MRCDQVNLGFQARLRANRIGKGNSTLPSAPIPMRFFLALFIIIRFQWFAKPQFEGIHWGWYCHQAKVPERGFSARFGKYMVWQRSQR
jgi:hypothetical protein